MPTTSPFQVWSLSLQLKLQILCSKGGKLNVSEKCMKQDLCTPLVQGSIPLLSSRRKSSQLTHLCLECY